MSNSFVSAGRRGRLVVALSGRVLLAACALLVIGSVGCSEGDVPFFTAPTSVPASVSGLQNAVSGLFAASRNDVGTVEFSPVAGYARDGAVFTNTEPRTVTYPLGVNPIPNTSGSIWPQEYQNITQAQQIFAALPKVSTLITPIQAASITGVVQTLQAYNYMLIAEAHDTLGLAILPAGVTGSTAPAAVCAKDAWQYIVALLDSGETQLVKAGSAIGPIKVPTGFAAVYTVSGPPGTLGSFASFNRVLAAKANLELAYAIARGPGGSAPTPTTPGAPNAAALNLALTDLTSSAMYNPSVLAPTPQGQFVAGSYVVTHDFSTQSQDLVNPVQQQIGTEAQLNDFVADVDTINDQRWHAKFILNPNPVQQQFYNSVASKYLYNMFSNPSSPIPIVREDELVIWHAEIELGLGNNAAALADANLLREVTGSCGAACPAGETALAPYPASDASSYETTRNDLMAETRISTTWESSADRTIEIRNYGMQAVSDTTWEHENPNVTTGDQHTTVNPIPQSELNGRGGTYTTTCK